jgi:hypothetical protein
MIEADVDQIGQNREHETTKQNDEIDENLTINELLKLRRSAESQQKSVLDKKRKDVVVEMEKKDDLQKSRKARFVLCRLF